jgi:biopolymer transport protein TolQ
VRYTPILTAFLLFQLPADAGAAQAAPAQALGASALWELVVNSGPVAQGVLVLLLVASLYSWTVILGKRSALRKATNESRRFLRGFRTANRLQEIAALGAECANSPLAQVFTAVFETYKRQTGGAGPPRNLVPLERSAQSAASEAITGLEQRMPWLATIAAVSPFVGLFGTVMGIVDAFQGLGTAGSATLRAVAPGISAALITTAAGLFVAVPALVAYNLFVARIRVLASAVDDFCRELLNALDEIPARPGPARTANAEGIREPIQGAGREADRGLYK